MTNKNTGHKLFQQGEDIHSSAINLHDIRNQFPILRQTINGKPLVYFDNGASTQKPISVVDAVSNFYTNYNSNIHRGVHTLSQKATVAYEKARETVQKFLNAKSKNEVIFTRGTTESINLVAYSLSKQQVKTRKKIVITYMEHHSNIVPWQMFCERNNYNLDVININQDGELIEQDIEALIDDNTLLVAFTHISNSLGTVNPVEKIMSKAKEVGALTLIDGAQAVSHLPIDVQELGCDFYCFSAHKLYGPTGVGVLYGRSEVLDLMNPFHGGGDMIKSVSFEKTTYADLPSKFEAGTPNIAGAIGLDKAIEFINDVGFDFIKKHDLDLFQYANDKLKLIDNLKFIGDAKHKTGLHSFTITNVHPHDLGTLLDEQGIAVRTGHHCAQPVMDFFNVTATTRSSYAIYNTKEEIDIFLEALKKSIQLLC